jgi:hypothetical protein
MQIRACFYIPIIYIDITPVAGKGKNMLCVEKQRHLLDVKAFIS